MTKPYSHSDLDSNQYPLDRDLIKCYDGVNHIVVMKLFPACFRGFKEYQKFHLRFYLPKTAVLRKGRKISRIIVMLCGLDEVRFFTLYDQLGQKFAEYNLASVLLPQPDHLNRHPRYRLGRKEAMGRPSDELWDRPEFAFERYLQVMGELDVLVRHLQYRNCSDTRSNCSFFERYFDGSTRVSLLGYSLGALIALANFLANGKNYNCCFLLNGGVQLGDLGTYRLFPKPRWDQFMSDLVKKWESEIANKRFGKQETAYKKLFNRVCLGSFGHDLQMVLKEHARRILLVMGGKDTVIPYQSLEKIEPEGYGLSIFKIPGLDIFLAIESEWDKWVDTVVTLIHNFEINASSELLPREHIVHSLIKLDRKYSVFKRNISCKDPEFGLEDEPCLKSDYHRIEPDNIRGEAHRGLFDQLLLASLGYFTFGELVEEMNSIYRKYSLAQIALKKKYLECSQLKDLVEMKAKHPQAIVKELVVKEDFLSARQLAEISRAQDRFSAL